MPVFEDAVRPYQLPASSPATAELNLFNLASQAPIVVIAGQANGIGALPQIQTSRRVFTNTTTYYMDESASEQLASEA